MVELRDRIFEALKVAHRSAAPAKTYEDGLREAAEEGDRFIENLGGHVTERSDGAFVALTRLVRNIRAKLPPDANQKG